MYVLGFDIGGTKCAVLLCRIDGEEVEWKRRKEIPTEPDWQHVLDCLCEKAEQMLVDFGVDRTTCRIGISCGGPLDAARTIICSPPNLPGWDAVPVVSYLSGRLGMPARMQNDADACALAEWKYGAGRGCSHMIFLTFGTGLGAGLILNGKLYTGASGMAGEIGHLRMSPDGPVGYGKAGSLEGFCSGGGIRQLAITRAKALEQQGNRASYIKGTIEGITAKDIAEAANRGEADAMEVFAESGRYFGRGLAILMDLLNPQVIVVGSIYARSHEYLDPEMYRQIRQEALQESAEVCKVVPASLGEQIGDYGSIMAALYE